MPDPELQYSSACPAVEEEEGENGRPSTTVSRSRRGPQSEVCVVPSSGHLVAAAWVSTDRSELGYPFPPAMSRMIENNIQRRWRERERVRAGSHTHTPSSLFSLLGRLVGGQSLEQQEERTYHQLLVDAQVFLAREVERRLGSRDSESHDRYI